MFFPVDSPSRTRWSRRWHRVRTRLRGDAGMTTAEYAVGTIAAVAFAGLLLKILTSDTVAEALNGIIEEALS